ncbi:hypothetical protein INT48_006179 [Thamnidium elegans]|uniref:Uncharacterized protein n=1 Tax=Thamnidium elegans TaxID=101142 RepID=A0A8H7VTW1_9FUNG|nr:hypothetical protein INT48_006179 [Thamnidium elegans]
MQNPMYASPQLPQMVATTPYFNGQSTYMMPQQQQQNPGYYTPMGPMQVGGPPLGGPQPYMAQPYPDMIHRRRECCDGCCDCNCCNYCLGIFASLCICFFCCGDEAEDCCC